MEATLRLPNIALEQPAGSHSLARGCSPQRSADKGECRRREMTE